MRQRRHGGAAQPGCTEGAMDIHTTPEDAQFLAEVAAEAIGWLPLGEGAYLHVGNPDQQELVITVVGMPDAAMAGMHVLWVG